MSDDLVKRLRSMLEGNLQPSPIGKQAADRIEELEAKLTKAVEAAIDAGASLAAAISLLDRGGKNAAPSNRMFDQMLTDYRNSLERRQAARRTERREVMPEMLAIRLYIKALERAEKAEERVEKLEAELHLMKTSGIVGFAVRNPNVMEYIKHWEGRAKTAEAKLAKAVEALDEVDFKYDMQNKGSLYSDSRGGWESAFEEAAFAARTTLAELTGDKDE